MLLGMAQAAAVGILTPLQLQLLSFCMHKKATVVAIVHGSYLHVGLSECAHACGVA